METNTISTSVSQNTSGQREAAIIPQELQRWNWGAFYFNWIWGLFNGVPFALLMFIPFLNIAIPFVLGIRGNEWAWRNRRWESLEHFQRTQRTWAYTSLGFFIFTVLMMIGFAGAGIYFYNTVSNEINSGLKSKLVTLVESNREVERALGKPYSFGNIPMTSVSIVGSEGGASSTVTIEGSSRPGKLHVKATREYGEWTIDECVLMIENHVPAIIIIKHPNVH